MTIRSENSSSNIFLTEKIPFALAALFAVFAWSVTQIVDRVVESPTIEYKIGIENIVSKSGGPAKRLVVKLTNLSSKKTFEDLQIVLRKVRPEDDTLLLADSGDVIPTVPGWSGDWKVRELLGLHSIIPKASASPTSRPAAL